MAEEIKDEDLQEDLSLDCGCEVVFLMADILRETISRGIDEEANGGKLPIPKEILLNKIFDVNLSRFDEECYITTGPEGKIYLAGSWLMRPLFFKGRMVPTMFFIEDHFDSSKVEMIPEKTGVELRKELWSHLTIDGSSYDIPADAKVPDHMNDANIFEALKGKGPPNSIKRIGRPPLVKPQYER